MNGHIGFQLKVFRESPSLFVSRIGDEHVCLIVCNCFTALPSQQSFPYRRQDGREKIERGSRIFCSPLPSQLSLSRLDPLTSEF